MVARGGVRNWILWFSRYEQRTALNCSPALVDQPKPLFRNSSRGMRHPMLGMTDKVLRLFNVHAIPDP